MTMSCFSTLYGCVEQRVLAMASGPQHDERRKKQTDDERVRGLLEATPARVRSVAV